MKLYLSLPAGGASVIIPTSTDSFPVGDVNMSISAGGAQNWSANNVTAPPYGESATCTLIFASTDKQLYCSQKDMDSKMNSFTVVYLVQYTLRNFILHYVGSMSMFSYSCLL